MTARQHPLHQDSPAHAPQQQPTSGFGHLVRRRDRENVRQRRGIAPPVDLESVRARSQPTERHLLPLPSHLQDALENLAIGRHVHDPYGGLHLG